MRRFEDSLLGALQIPAKARDGKTRQRFASGFFVLCCGSYRHFRTVFMIDTRYTVRPCRMYQGAELIDNLQGASNKSC
ncbi:hypothetical protein [Paludibacterium denitrificans]|uniref:Uncharacterized protein n=1 Tax=Paludibacterium denitrificans TaxID=2675226 RepID=A0A844G804_9NEIS|nr:hypothetical protein [Paludibacterium denitrificans]MTD32486.1 hypothetical protein [Paludibacterium denitrificans]